MVCAGTGARGTGTCQGDSGGPIIINREAIDYVAGLTSFGSGCALEGFYDVYSRVPAFLVQINEALELPPPPADPKEDNKPTNPPVTENGDENNGGGAFSLSFFWLLISLRFLRPFLRRQAG
jgi:secreted trypsin-like serine protease